MTGKRWLPLLLLAACTTRTPAPHAPTSAPRARAPLRVAVTVDDLPAADALPGWSKLQTLQAIVGALQAHHVPEPVGFVNGIYGEDDDARQALQVWLDAGYPVGNHSYSHLSASQGGVAFLADVARNDAWLRERVPASLHTRYMRLPFLERGADASQRATIRQGLHAQGMRIANVSLDFADWAFTGAYTRCVQREDTFALARLSQGYLQNARAALFWSDETGQRVFQRRIPQVLLIHAIVATASNIDALLTQYEADGVEWITLAQALTDPAFAEPPDEDLQDWDVIVEQVRRHDLPVHGFVPRALPLLELPCR